MCVYLIDEDMKVVAHDEIYILFITIEILGTYLSPTEPCTLYIQGVTMYGHPYLVHLPDQTPDVIIFHRRCTSASVLNNFNLDLSR
jgi:hypothetical protein